ncbi:hypothetical protein CCY01nite_48400 [Chitinophaga cymbidii]|uniref:Uncharacterized protein n=1 Tax=Chitinophaga cymbidii TaxID=1096750 RepID=A0A512RSA3_9BACT|nr:hypothetical protein CCY01nite_48400 [Chitinophaga cymbidii]
MPRIVMLINQKWLVRETDPLHVIGGEILERTKRQLFARSKVE